VFDFFFGFPHHIMVSPPAATPNETETTTLNESSKNVGTHVRGFQSVFFVNHELPRKTVKHEKQSLPLLKQNKTK
jgi:hypothetical protein